MGAPLHLWTWLARVSVGTSPGAQDSVFMGPPLLDWLFSLATENACSLFTLEKGAKDGACENLLPPPP